LDQSTANRRASQSNQALRSYFARPNTGVGLNNQPLSFLT
jgi:hypothetical protein